jgi:hypothetical protein
MPNGATVCAGPYSPCTSLPCFLSRSRKGFSGTNSASAFNFIALDYLVFTTEVIGNIRQSYPVGKIIAALLALTLLVVWLLRRPIQRAGLVESSRMGQLPWVAAMMLGFGVLAYQQLAPEFSSNSFANELADNGWRSFLSAARQNRLDYRQFYASRPDAEVMADLQRLSGQGRIRVSRPPLQAVAYQPAIQTAHQPNLSPAECGGGNDGEHVC